MRLHPLSRPQFVKALGVGIATALILSAVMVPAFRAGIPPMPKPPSLAFAEAVLGPGVPLPVGLLLHVLYVTVWSLVFVALLPGRPTFLRALALALVLWAIALVVFFPINGWGLLGLGIGPALIPAALVPHLLFAVVLWGLCRLAFGAPQPRPGHRAPNVARAALHPVAPAARADRCGSSSPSTPGSGRC